ncbi:hypothetical protein DFP72DRAFT_909444 [Ephemerocybe angulata]|uniref:Uncharacterized protein n=1 Tax=Ephemerocybe angulata TaxID=980116 RepID=A0A8H6M2I0_9AGAR|nr:hypothetical protein DFP72DRAFT_909444 [Tulosesus angulatus]
MSRRPDGFQIQKPLAKAPKFVSAFDAPKQQEKLPELRRRPPPALSITAPPAVAPQIPALRPAVAPTLQTAAPPQIPALRPAIAPQLPAPPKPPSKVLKPLAPPLPAAPPPEAPRKHLSTITTTRFARSTDISTADGVEEVAAIFLNGQTVETPAPESRGVDMSPEKRDKGKGKAKFVRSGLAARASAYFGRTETNMVLWHKDMKRHALSVPDMQVKIVKVLVPPRKQLKMSLPVSVVALCEVKSVYRTKELAKIVFSFSSSSEQLLSDGDMHAFDVGHWISVWKPWQTALQPGSRSDSMVNSLPLPSFTQQDLEVLARLPISDKVVVCKKFMYSKD